MNKLTTLSFLTKMISQLCKISKRTQKWSHFTRLRIETTQNNQRKLWEFETHFHDEVRRSLNSKDKISCQKLRLNCKKIKTLLKADKLIKSLNQNLIPFPLKSKEESLWKIWELITNLNLIIMDQLVNEFNRRKSYSISWTAQQSHQRTFMSQCSQTYIRMNQQTPIIKVSYNFKYRLERQISCQSEIIKVLSHRSTTQGLHIKFLLKCWTNQRLIEITS